MEKINFKANHFLFFRRKNIFIFAIKVKFILRLNLIVVFSIVIYFLIGLGNLFKRKILKIIRTKTKNEIRNEKFEKRIIINSTKIFQKET